jgi:CheY-like chemotaxis protein
VNAIPPRILIVDDERSIADLLATVLRVSGFEVQKAYNGMDAISAARSFVPDFVISDYAMPPGINGLEACVQMKKMLPGVRIILLSGQHLDGEFRPYHSQGYEFRLLTKPVRPGEILEILRAEDVAAVAEKHLCVLNVDDVEAHRHSISRLFSRAGFEVLEASTGGEAIRKARQAKPDLILMGVHLPDINGYRVCAEIKRDPEIGSTTVVHLTASAPGDEAAQCSAEAGAEAFFPYPITPSNLIHQVRELLQMRYLQQGD